MTGRTGIPVVPLVFWLLSLLFSGICPAQAQSPNVIVIYTDDQGYGDVSALNPEAKFQTPNLDRLAKEGISFTRGHSSDSVCTPSRYSLLTGRYAWRTSLKRGVFPAEKQCLIPDSRMTLANLFKDNGYHTAMVGKWHLGMDFPGTPEDRDWSQPVQDMPLDKGFDYFYGIPASLNYGILAWFEGRHAAIPPTHYTNKKRNPRYVDYRIMPPYEDQPGRSKDPTRLVKRNFEIAEDFIDNQCLTRFTDKAIAWMKDRAGNAASGTPFFLYLPYTSPHYPVCPLPEFHGQGDAGAYGEFVIETDYHVGRILDFLESSGLDDQTLIVFTSDNGPERSWKGRIREFAHDSRGGLREGKRSVYEGGHRVPFLVRWPAGIKAPGRQWDKPVGQVDLLATFAELMGVDLPDTAGEDSQSFASVLLNPRADHDRLPLINHGNDGRYAITDGDWKLVLPGRNQSAELYNLTKDRAENRNLAGTHPDKVREMTRKMTGIITNGRTTPGAIQSNDTDYWEDLTWMANAEPSRNHEGDSFAWRKTAELAAPEAIQAAAADEQFVYAIASRQVAQYDRVTGRRIATSRGNAKHLNSGFFWKGKLLCAHSNYPQIPEQSEIKVLDPETMQLSTFKALGNVGGSLTWVVRHDGHWWCNFARYGIRNHGTFLVKYDDRWREKGRWTYPKAVIDQLGLFSLSGGLWHKNELLVTGHDKPEIYRLRLPRTGSVLTYIGKQSVPFTGQGFAEDPHGGGLVGISRAKRQVVFIRPAPE